MTHVRILSYLGILKRADVNKTKGLLSHLPVLIYRSEKLQCTLDTLDFCMLDIGGSAGRFDSSRYD